MQGFPKVILPTEVITVLPGVTPMASRFNLPIGVVTVNIRGSSPLTWLGGVGETGWSPGPVIGMIWFSVMVGLAAQGSIRSLWAPVSILVVTSFWGRASVAAVRLVSVDEVVGSTRMGLSVLWVIMGWGPTPSILALGAG